MAKKKTPIPGESSFAELMGQPRAGEPSAAERPAPEPTARAQSAADEDRLRQALLQIAEVVSKAVNGSLMSDEDHAHDDHGSPAQELGCIPKSLPSRLLVKAAATAIQLNPVNAPAFWRTSAIAAGFAPQPQFIAAMTTKYWGPRPRRLTVSFMERAAPELRARIISHLNAWARTGCISFVETQETGQVRISREPGGYWSYLGTDILHIPRDRQTMNLDGFTMRTPDDEYRRVVRHEAGHTLGFPHEHMRRDIIARIDPEKAYDYALRTFGWDRRMVDEQILTPLDDRTIFGTPPDQTSIMCYQLPAEITRDGQPILGGLDINATDYRFVGKIYPKPSSGLREDQDAKPKRQDDWPEDQDVQEVEIVET